MTDDKTPVPSPEENAADTGLAFSIGQSTTTGTGPGAGTGSLDAPAPDPDPGFALDFSDDENDDRRSKTQDHDLGGSSVARSAENHTNE